MPRPFGGEINGPRTTNGSRKTGYSHAKKKKKKNDVGLLPNTTQKKFTQKGPKI